ncbi:hypothetical protein [Nocardia farcinica]|uniref:hypothetical protein n=1 Tax=Nocardia farcinica TaxID=37329 RepID=UPI001894C3ED|nr:hypothetical protein [Nocardia farcinica]MBF6187607.1 hypothetical protein [Nocardia farcinica]
MTAPFPSPAWYREFADGHSTLCIELTPDGRVEFAVHGEQPGYRVSVSQAVAAEIASFIHRPLHPTRPEDYWRDQFDPRDFGEELR